MTASTVKILNQRTETVPIDTVRPHPENVNHAQMEAVGESIETNGFYGSLIVQASTGYILAGSHRWKTMRAAGADGIPVTFVDVDDQTARRIMLADNRTTRLGQDDQQGLADLLTSILDETGDLAGTGFTAEDLDKIVADTLKAVEESTEKTAPDKLGSDQSGELKEKFQVLVTCEDEAAQARLLEKLSNEGWACRALYQLGVS